MLRSVALAGALLFITSVHSSAQTSQVPPIQLPTVVVTAQKEPAEAQTLPVSLTAVSRDTLINAGVSLVREAAIYAPNTQFTDFTARKLSNPRFRGIGASPANPSITTYFDGVPQLNSNSSSIELIDVEQVEFVRGPQSALFGRNTLGGVINVASTRPSLTEWSATIGAPFASNDARDLRGGFSGPLADGRVGVSGSIAYSRRDGYTRNVVTGNDVDYREGVIGKGQLLWTPSSVWETRLIVAGERARDGDYALSDLGGLRRNPHRTARDFEGHTDRDLMAATVLTRRAGSALNFSTTTGFVRWKTVDATDLDYTPLPLLRRNNAEDSFQFTQEVRFASGANAPVRVSDVPLKWQAGVFFFTQSYEQDAVNTLAPFLLSPLVPFAVSQHAPQSALDDLGVGVYGQVTATLAGRLDLSAGARVDHENKDAALNTFFSPAIAPARRITAEESFSNVSPQVSAGLRLQPDKMLYAAVGRGFKAGGFNAASPAGSEAYGEEHTWNAEGGVKTTWAGGRVTANAAVFRIDWEDMQLNLPDPAVPAQFFIANVGAAESKGVEFELNARVYPGVDLFSGVGYTRARFQEGSVSSGVNVAGNEIPNTPEYTATFGTQVSRVLRADLSAYGRAEATFYGAFRYDDLNLAEQEAYSLANFRAGVRSRYVAAEVWVRNAFDTDYVPVAFAFDPRLAPSGFLGESGAPRVFGISAGVTF
ncbi:MAG: TonB-dependent receptor [Gaiellales bacterium]